MLGGINYSEADALPTVCWVGAGKPQLSSREAVALSEHCTPCRDVCDAELGRCVGGGSSLRHVCIRCLKVRTLSSALYRHRADRLTRAVFRICRVSRAQVKALCDDSRQRLTLRDQSGISVGLPQERRRTRWTRHRFTHVVLSDLDPMKP